MKVHKYICVSVGGAACLSAVVVALVVLVVGPPTGTGDTTHRYLDAKYGSVPGSTIWRSLGCGRVDMCTATFELVGRRRHRLVKSSTHTAIYCYCCMIDRLLPFFVFLLFFVVVYSPFRLDGRLRQCGRIEADSWRSLLEMSPGHSLRPSRAIPAPPPPLLTLFFCPGGRCFCRANNHAQRVQFSSYV